MENNDWSCKRRKVSRLIQKQNFYTTIVGQFGMDGVVLTCAKCNIAASSFLSLQICSLLTSIYHYVSVLDYPPIYLLLLVPHSSAMTLKRVLTIEYQFLRHLYSVTISGNYLYLVGMLRYTLLHIMRKIGHH